MKLTSRHQCLSQDTVLKVVESRISSYCGTFSIAVTDPPTRTWNEGGIACKCTTYECQAFSNMKKLQ